MITTIDREAGYVRRLLLLAVMLLLTACGGGHNAAPGTATPSTKTDHTDAEARSQRVLDDAVQAGAPGCSAAVGVKGQVVWTGVRGVADMSTGNPITTHAVFDIASVSKQFTATALLLLVDSGKLTLDDRLSRYMPELPTWATTVTVGQLMHQTSGIPEYVGLLGEIVHRVSREPLAQYLTGHIFHPLGLAMVLDPTGPIPDKAVSYEKSSDQYRATTSGWEQVGDGGIQTTPGQLVHWADNYRTGRVGGSQLLDAQLSGAVPTEPGGADKYGAGIYLRANGAIDHDGAWGGFVTAFRVAKDRTTSLAISCNTDKQDPEALADSLATLWM
jgi:CubicO group peptidase (beta-lactamase class C family)